MAGSNGTNGHINTPIKEVLKLPTIEELKRAYDDGLPQTLFSGVEVLLHPLQPEKLLMADDVPNPLTQLVMTMLFPLPKPEAGPETFPDEAPANPVDEFLSQQRQRVEDIKEFVKAVDIVCAAVLIDPSIVPYLSLSDRMWLFRLAWMPVEVLRYFRLEPAQDVGVVADGAGHELPTEQPAAVDAAVVQHEPADRLPV